MPKFTVPVVEIAKVGKHPNADTLSITQVEGCPAILRTGDLNPGDIAVYIPVESVIKETSPWVTAAPFLKFKNGVHRVAAVKLRGIFSMGILLPLSALAPFLPAPVQVGDDLAGVLGIVKYEEPEPVAMNGLMERDPGLLPVYDVENYRKNKHIFEDGEDVVVTEKIHGCNARFIHDGARLWVGSHRTWKKLESNDVWTRIAREYDLEAKLADYPFLGVYGEVYGDVQDLKYGLKPGQVQFAVFDMYDGGRNEHSFVDFENMLYTCARLRLPTVPILYQGPFSREVIEGWATGTSTIAGHIREGIVIKSRVEGFHRAVGRKQLKLVSEAYLLRKGGTERH